jgi:hypothetical protein
VCGKARFTSRFFNDYFFCFNICFVRLFTWCIFATIIKKNIFRKSYKIKIMKKSLLILMLFVWQINFAQNNLSPTENVSIGTLDPLSKLTVAGSITINSGVNNTLSRPAVSAGTLGYGEIRGYSSHGNALDDGFLRLSAGGGSTPWAKTYIDMSGYSTVPDMNRNIVFGISGVERMRINSEGYIGIGTTSLTSPLTVGEYHGVKLSVGGTSWVSKNILQTSWITGIGDFTDINVVGQFANNASIRLIENGNVGIGVANPDAKLAVNGTIHSKEVKVDLNGWVWPDYVFKKEYDLPTLEEVEMHIKEKGHLKNIPSEEDVQNNGINLGEMNMNLLKKIEEMTLYMIEMKKENEKQDEKIKALESKLLSKN